MRFFEDADIGAQREFGSFTFTAEDIKRFAAQFDPQRFHLDEEEGRKSLFGALAASGWHVASVCMKLLVADGQRRMSEARARGETIGTPGPSPGIRDLRWLRPVLAGDTISFSTGIVSKRVSESRPGWGVVQTRADGVNQRGEHVYTIGAWSAFMPLRDSAA
jgi:acyl dehydratase